MEGQNLTQIHTTNFLGLLNDWKVQNEVELNIKCLLWFTNLDFILTNCFKQRQMVDLG